MFEMILLLSLGFICGYFYRAMKKPEPTALQPKPAKPMNQHQRLMQKAIHQSDSDRIRELNTLNANESAFLRLLKQVFVDHDIAVKDKRFYILDRDRFPRAIFEYRDGHSPLKMEDREDGLPLYLYKALISSSELKKDQLMIKSMQNSTKIKTAQ